MTDSLIDPLGNIPRYAIFRGKRVRISHYEADDQKFTIIEPDDSTRRVTRDRLKFLPEKKTEDQESSKS